MGQPQMESQPETATDQPASTTRASSAMARRLTAFAWFLFILTTLLAFPGHLTIVAFTICIIIFCCLVLNQVRHAALASLLAGVILIIKTPSIQIQFVLLVTVLLLAGLAYYSNRPKLRWLAFTITAAAVAFFGIKRTLDAQASNGISIDDQRPIVCIGDSLTEGEKGGYPAELQKHVKAPVLNYGRNGFTTQMVIDKLLPEIILERPQLAVVTIGGHDYNTGQPRNETKARLKQIIQTLVDADIEVVIVECIRGLVTDPFYGVERELADEFDLELIPDTIIRRFFFFSPIAPPGIWLTPKQHLSEDGLHPNERGQIEFAKVVADVITRK